MFTSRHPRVADEGLQGLHVRRHGLQGGLEEKGHDGLAQLLAPGRRGHLVGRCVQLRQGDDRHLLQLGQGRGRGRGVAGLGGGRPQERIFQGQLLKLDKLH